MSKQPDCFKVAYQTHSVRMIQTNDIVRDPRPIGGTLAGAGQALAGHVSTLASDIIHFIYPPECIVCEEPLAPGNAFFCTRCRDTAQNITVPICLYCRNQIADPRIGCVCGESPKVSALWSCGMFDNFYRAVVHAIKYDALFPLSAIAADILAERLRETESIPSIDLIVPIPLHWTRQLQRGFNQSELIARRVGEMLGIEVSNRALKRVRRTKDQTRLSARQREANMRGAFAASQRARLVDKRILLVDDVTTTGSTLNEAANALRRAGCRNVFAAVVAVASLD